MIVCIGILHTTTVTAQWAVDISVCVCVSVCVRERYGARARTHGAWSVSVSMVWVGGWWGEVCKPVVIFLFVW